MAVLARELSYRVTRVFRCFQERALHITLIRMKRCPVCNREYDDQTMNFCLADGASLTSASGASIGGTTPSDPYGPTEAVHAEERRFAEMSTMVTPVPQFVRPAAATPHVQPAVNNRNLFLLVAVVVLLASVVVLAFVLIRSKKDDNGVDVRGKQDDSNSTNNDNKVSGATTSPTPTPVTTPVEMQSPSATATPTPNTSSARAEVLAVMHSWGDSLTRQDLGSNLRLYADRLDAYYQLGNASKDQVRANRQSIFAKYYSSTNVQLSNIAIEVDPSGTRATVSYDNSYDWRGGAKYLVGKSHNSMILSKVGSQWLITSERHLQTYSEDNN